jgi:hypothetical protein
LLHISQNRYLSTPFPWESQTSSTSLKKINSTKKLQARITDLTSTTPASNILIFMNTSQNNKGRSFQCQCNNKTKQHFNNKSASTLNKHKSNKVRKIRKTSCEKFMWPIAFLGIIKRPQITSICIMEDQQCIQVNGLQAKAILVLKGHLPGLLSDCILHTYDTPRRTTDHLWPGGQQVLPLVHHPHMKDALSCHTPNTSWVIQHSQAGSWPQCPGTPHRLAKAQTAENRQTESVPQITL